MHQYIHTNYIHTYYINTYYIYICIYIHIYGAEPEQGHGRQKVEAWLGGALVANPTSDAERCVCVRERERGRERGRVCSGTKY